MRPRNHVDGHQLADASRSGRACVGGGLHGRDVAAHDGRHVARADLFPADERDLRRLTMASAASIIATRPFVSTIPSASPIAVSLIALMAQGKGLRGAFSPQPSALSA